MSQPPDPPDDDLLEALVAEVFDELDPVPDSAVAAAQSFLRWRASDADIALIDEAALEPIPVRDGDAPAGLLRFTSTAHVIEIVVEGTAVTGTIEPWAGGHASLEFDGGPVPIDIDEFGRFQVSAPRATTVRMRFVIGHDVVTTNWFLLSRDRSN